MAPAFPRAAGVTAEDTETGRSHPAAGALTRCGEVFRGGALTAQRDADNKRADLGGMGP